MAYLEPKASFKACQTRKMIMHTQSPGIIKTVYSKIFRDIYAYSGILRHIQSHSQVRNYALGGKSPQPFLKIEKSVLIFLFAKRSILNI